jgi:hypothetical protein
MVSLSSHMAECPLLRSFDKLKMTSHKKATGLNLSLCILILNFKFYLKPTNVLVLPVMI